MSKNLADYLPPGFEVMEAGTGRKIDCTVAYRGVGKGMWRLVVSFGKDSVAGALRVDPTKAIYAVAGFNWNANQVALAIMPTQPPGAIKGVFKDGTLYFTLRPKRLMHHKLKQSAVESVFTVESNPARNLILATVTMPGWVQAVVALDNSTDAGRRRAIAAAQVARLRA